MHLVATLLKLLEFLNTIFNVLGLQDLIGLLNNLMVFYVKSTTPHSSSKDRCSTRDSCDRFCSEMHLTQTSHHDSLKDHGEQFAPQLPIILQKSVATQGTIVTDFVQKCS